MDTHDDQAKAGRVSTGDAGLDRVLGGGFMRGSVAIVQGTPGAGKTTLANQMAFANARSGGRTVYITLLSESHGRMTSALSPMRFFDHGDVGETIHYISGYSVLMEEGARAAAADGGRGAQPPRSPTGCARCAGGGCSFPL